MDILAGGSGLRPPNTRANRPEVIANRALIVGHYQGGTSISEISRLMGISKSTVRRWIRRFEGEGHVETRPRSGRPSVTSPADDARLLQAVRQAPRTTAVTWKRYLRLRCHPVTTRRRIHEAGLKCCVPAVKELTEVVKTGRLRFAQEHIRYGLDFGRK
ncbi:putative Transposable element Tc1 transposase-like 55 [Homarus americanus]|uniref:Putative Transposable element Tc1 transposase-like 55 n=1 Tax=Homarus americanus TaxID=6706 RepID=A0A8J5K2L0_HOMAM|nr:putative Transposable element Tc1 transposase-like 55 [Homarus americanus]